MIRVRSFLLASYSNTRPGQLLGTLAMAGFLSLLVCMPTEAMAQQLFDLPVVDDMVCGFVSYARSKLAPMLAVGIIIISIIGHWLGVSKMWSQMLYVGVGLGVIMGVATAFARYGNMAAQCVN